MSRELFYTSAPRGLKPGSTGFCTVAMTRGLAGPLVERLEWLSGYRPLFPAGDPRAARNPVSFAHWRVAAGPQTVSVLTRVCFAGLDHTQRSNKFAHHLILDAGERPPAGPAWVLRQPDVMATGWRGGEPAELGAGRPIPTGDSPPAPCRAWAAATGDAGWAGALAEAYLAEPAKHAYLLYSPGADVLELVAEAIALLPESRRWQVTFNTYFTDLPAGLSCGWRCCVAGTPAAKEAARSVAASGNLLIDLTAVSPAAPDSPYVRFARSGVLEEGAAPVKSPVIPAEAEPATPAATDPRPGGVTTRESLSPNPRPAVEEIEWPLPAAHRTPVATRPRSSARGRWPFWVITLVWPLLVATLAWNHLRSRRATVATTPTAPSHPQAALVEQNAALREQVVALTARMDAEKRAQFERGQAAARNELPDPRIWVRRSEVPASAPASLHTDAEYATLLAERDQVKRELAKVSTAATPASADHVIRDDAGRVLSQWVAVADNPRAGGAPPDVTLAAWPKSKPGRVALSIPVGSSSVYKQKAAPDGGVTLYRTSGDGLSGDLDRARLFFADRNLVFRWLTADKDDKEQKAIASLLLFAAARVSDDAGNELGTIQFVEPERCDLVLRDHRAVFKKPMPPPQAGSLRLVVVTRPSTWSAIDGGGAGASLTFRGGAGGAFSVDADARGVATNWPEIRADALAQKRLLDAEVDRLRQILPKLKTNEIDPSRRKEDAYKTVFAAYDQAAEKARQQAAVADDLNRPFRATLALCLSNGAVLATIELSQGSAKPD